jgi:hypothetical protein
MMAEDSVSGAKSPVRTLVASSVDTCYADPGTSEMHFVGALDHARDTLCTCSFRGISFSQDIASAIFGGLDPSRGEVVAPF